MYLASHLKSVVTGISFPYTLKDNQYREWMEITRYPSKCAVISVMEIDFSLNGFFFHTYYIKTTTGFFWLLLHTVDFLWKHIMNQENVPRDISLQHFDLFDTGYLTKQSVMSRTSFVFQMSGSMDVKIVKSSHSVRILQ